MSLLSRAWTIRNKTTERVTFLVDARSLTLGPRGEVTVDGPKSPSAQPGVAVLVASGALEVIQRG